MGQLTFVLNMFFGLSVAALAFAASLVRNAEWVLTGCPKFVFQIGLVSLCLAVLASCAAVISRLFDYRYTAQKVRADEKEEGEESALFKYKSSMLGRLTWRLFWAQVITLGIGFVGLMTGVLSVYGSRIW